MRDAVIIYLLNQLANMATPQQLVDAAKCYDCIPQGLKPAVIVYLQDAILAGGGGGAGSGIQAFYLEPGEDPTVLGLVPTGGAWGSGGGVAGVAYNLAGDFWTYSDGAWVKIISA